MSRLKKGAGARRLGLAPVLDASNDTFRRVLDAIAIKRRKPHLSLSKAARESGTTVTTIRRYAGGIVTVRSGRLDVTATDCLPRAMRMLTPHGEATILTRSAKTASRIGRYNNALREFLNAGDARALRPFAGRTVRNNGEKFEFVADAATIRRLARAGGIHFLDVYDDEARS